MLFNSIEYLFFLPLVFLLYWFVAAKNLRIQNFILIICSYIFYGWWDYRFLFLLLFSTLLDFYSGIMISRARTDYHRKFWLVLSIGINLGFLGFFKYYNFFIESVSNGLSYFGLQSNLWSLNIILPVGISFYTFHGLSYVLDIYYKRINPTYRFIDYGLFVSYFPLLVAGPIERATHLLPQIEKSRKFDYKMATDGLRQILWGLFKKVVIADNSAELANIYFNNYTNYEGFELFLGALFFTFQIYGDFSGYSDMALGTSKLFGINLLKNFSYPYFSRNIAEFWRRWHISLSSWFKDYLYIPLGGSKGSTWIKVRNTFIIFLVSGFWHGANWTFVFWGFLNALYFLPSLLLGKNRNHMDIVAKDTFFPNFKELISIVVTFVLVVFAWTFFRAESLSHAFDFIGRIFTFKGSANWLNLKVILCLFLISVFMITEWIGRRDEFAIQNILNKLYWLFRWIVYYILIILIMTLAGKQQQFIYFQF